MIRHTSGTAAGPACAPGTITAFTFGIRRASQGKTQTKRAAAAADHLESVPGAVVIAEQAEGRVLRLTVAVCPPMRADQAARLAEACPEYVPGSFTVAE